MQTFSMSDQHEMFLFHSGPLLVYSDLESVPKLVFKCKLWQNNHTKLKHGKNESYRVFNAESVTAWTTIVRLILADISIFLNLLLVF